MSRLPDAPLREKFYGVVNRSVARLRGEGGRWDELDRNLEALGWSKSVLEDVQLRRLRELLHYAKVHVPYYKRLFNEHGFRPEHVTSTDDLRQLPVLTKELIDQHFSELISDEFRRDRLKQRRTGGSSGRTLNFLVTAGEFERQMAMCQRTLVMAGIRPAGSQAKLWGYSSDQTWGNRISFLTGRLYFASSQTTAEHYRRWARYMQQIRPVMAYGYAGFLADFANFVEQSDIEIEGLTAAFSTAEMLHPEQRTLIARGLNTKVFDAYGCREVPRVASECQHGSMHVMSDEVLLEVDERERDSGVGSILLTPLLSRAMPLIRYEVGDEACRGPVSCRCGLPFPTIGMQLGKEYLRIEFPGGGTLHCSALTSMIHKIACIRRFQIQQIDAGSLRIVYETEPASAAEAQHRLHRVLEEIESSLLHGRIAVSSARVDAIETTPAGKRPMFRRLS